MKTLILFVLLMSSVLAQPSTVVRRTTTTTVQKDGTTTTTVTEEIRPVVVQTVVQVGPDKARPEDYYGYVYPDQCYDVKYPAPPMVYRRDRMDQVTDILSLVAVGVIFNNVVRGHGCYRRR